MVFPFVSEPILRYRSPIFHFGLYSIGESEHPLYSRACNSIKEHTLPEGPFIPLDIPDFTELHKHHKALEEEFKGLDLDTNNTPDEIRQKCRKFAINNLEKALTKIVLLVDGADKETTQLSAAKAIITIAQGTSPKDDDDALKKFFESINEQA